MTHFVGRANAANHSTMTCAVGCPGLLSNGGVRKLRKAFCWSTAHMREAEEMMRGERRRRARPRVMPVRGIEW